MLENNQKKKFVFLEKQKRIIKTAIKKCQTQHGCAEIQ